jgi:hypothetical protein
MEMEETLNHLFTHQLKNGLNSMLTPSLTGPLRTLWDRRSSIEIGVTFPHTKLCWHIADWHPQISVRGGQLSQADYRFEYVASELFGYIQGQFNVRRDGQVRAYRQNRACGENLNNKFSFSALDPGRLFGEDLYNVVDATFHWHPLIFF